VVLGPLFVGEGYPKFRTQIFKSHSLPSMWPVLVEFRSMSSEGGWRKKIEDRIIAVKRKSADNGRPNNKLENWHVLPLKAARRYAIANVKWILGPRDTSDLISTFSFTFAMRRHRSGSVSPPFSVCSAWQRSRMQNLRRLLENVGPILTSLWTKVHEILQRCRRSLLLANDFARLSTSRFVKEIFTIKSRSSRKTRQM